MEQIPQHMITAYTLNGEIPIHHWFFNESSEKKSIATWSDSYLQQFINRFTIENIMNNRHGSEQYKNASQFHVNAIVKYIDSIYNKMLL